MQPFKNKINLIFFYFGRFSSYLYSHSSSNRFKSIKNKLYSAWISREFKIFGKDSSIKSEMVLIGGSYISIGDRTSFGSRATLTAWDKYGFDRFCPEIIIGNNVSIGDDSHITAINRIEIGNNVLTGKKITITDNAHGKSNIESLMLPPTLRALYSPGPVFIEDGVWIGDKVTILANVRIGKNSIIGSNAVVTKDIPANSVAGGIPARIIKLID
jgi:acetyltransferase-like isoleucine patch superfamily enzyme